MMANLHLLPRPRKVNWELRAARLRSQRLDGKLDILAERLRAEAIEAERRLGCD